MSIYAAVRPTHHVLTENICFSDIKYSNTPKWAAMMIIQSKSGFLH